jgi:hypothetical protein
MVKTKNVLLLPYPDIVGWWKSVTNIFTVSEMKLERMAEKLNNFYQEDDESCKDYFDRFETMYTTIKDLGKTFDQYHLGERLYRGLLATNKRVILPIMMSNDFDCSFNNLAVLFKFVDDMDEEPNPNKSTKESNPMLANLVSQPYGNSRFTSYDTTQKEVATNSASIAPKGNSNQSRKRYSGGCLRVVIIGFKPTMGMIAINLRATTIVTIMVMVDPLVVTPIITIIVHSTLEMVVVVRTPIIIIIVPTFLVVIVVVNTPITTIIVIVIIVSLSQTPAIIIAVIMVVVILVLM